MPDCDWQLEDVPCDYCGSRDADVFITGRDRAYGLPGLDLPAKSFDAVTMWQALEHVPSPQATLEGVARLLRPGGRLMVVCPRLDSLDAKWFGSCWFALELPRHLWHFTGATLRRHLEATGFEVERVRPIRRPAILRRSFAQVADETGRGLDRRLARSRLVTGAMSWVTLLAGRTGQMMAVARRRWRPPGLS